MEGILAWLGSNDVVEGLVLFAKLDKEMAAELKWVNENNEGTAMLSELIFSIKRMEKREE